MHLSDFLELGQFKVIKITRQIFFKIAIIANAVRDTIRPNVGHNGG